LSDHIEAVGSHQGADILCATLRSERARVRILNLGAITQSWHVDGAPVILGYEDPRAYVTDPYYLGAIVGRVANRTAGARFQMGGVIYDLPQNDGRHHLHGSLSKCLWDMSCSGEAVTLRYHSPDGDGGYPGAVDFSLVIRLDGVRLSYEMRAVPDRPTPINLAQHNYYNLDGGADINRHKLRVAAEGWTPVDDELIALGTIEPVRGTGLDFLDATRLSDISLESGIDANLVLTGAPGAAAELRAENGRRLRLHTDQPGLQVYSGGGLGTPFRPYQGLCLEPQGFPNALNTPAFPSIIATPEAPYHQLLEVEIS
jgi:aldose 1-epimerase